MKTEVHFKFLLLAAIPFLSGIFLPQSLHAADTVSVVLAAPEKILLAKQLNSNAQTAGLRSINAYLHQRVSGLANIVLRSGKSPFPPEFIYAVTGKARANLIHRDVAKNQFYIFLNVIF
jgi:hypothetical protein